MRETSERPSLFRWLLIHSHKERNLVKRVWVEVADQHSPPLSWKQEGDKHMPSEVSQTEKDTYYMLSLIYGI